MNRFVQADRHTAYLLPPSIDEWLPETHLARFVVEVIERLDLSELIGRYAGRGSAAHHPAVLLGLLIYGYASGVHSSRKIERATYDSVAFRFVAANTHPDHDTLATFRRRFLPQVEALNASKHKALSWAHAERIEAQLRQEVQGLLALAEQADGSALPDGLDVPAEIARRETRLAAIAQAKAKIEQRAQERQRREQQDYEAKLARREAARAAGKKPCGPQPEPPAPGPRATDQVNLTDEDSRIMPAAGGGFTQGYNAQAAVDTATLLVLSTQLTQAPNDKQQLAPALERLGALPAALGQIDTVLADSGYFSAANVAACEAAGIAPLVALQRDAHHLPVLERFAEDAPPPATDDPVVRMAHRLGTRAGRALYALRKQTVEPVFGIVKQVMGWRRVSLRGLAQAAGEWTLAALAWNIKRLHVLRAA